MKLLAIGAHIIALGRVCKNDTDMMYPDTWETTWDQSAVNMDAFGKWLYNFENYSTV